MLNQLGHGEVFNHPGIKSHLRSLHLKAFDDLRFHFFEDIAVECGILRFQSALDPNH